MKRRIIISESDRKRILSLHNSFANKLVLENPTNYTIADIKKELNTNYGATFNSNPYNNKFGSQTAGVITNALEKIKTSGVPNKPSTEDKPTTVDTTQNQTKDDKPTTVDNKPSETKDVTPTVVNTETPPKEGNNGADDSRKEE